LFVVLRVAVAGVTLAWAAPVSCCVWYTHVRHRYRVIMTCPVNAFCRIMLTVIRTHTYHSRCSIS